MIPSDIQGYHAHIYYAPEQRAEAEALRTAVEQAFPHARFGRWHDRPVGPHPSPMFQIAFAAADFATIAPWLMLRHGSLTIFMHPETGDDYADHAHHAMWIGAQQALKLDQFKRN